jgi:uncharacterized FlaG/YvyC family protein
LTGDTLEYQAIKGMEVSTETVKQFLLVASEHKEGKLSQEEALNKLERVYSSAIKKNTQKMMKLLDKNKLYEYVRYTADELIDIYDKEQTTIIEEIIESYIFDLEHKAHARRNKFIFSGEPVPDEYRYGQPAFSESDRNQARFVVCRERDEIAELCQENREIAEYYKKYKLEIINIFDTQTQKVKIPAIEDHYLMQILKHEAIQTYKYMKKAIEIKLVQYTDAGYFNFLCDRGCVGYFFSTAGYTDFKRIFPYILISGEPCDYETLRNGAKHGKTDEWDSLSIAVFGEAK